MLIIKNEIADSYLWILQKIAQKCTGRLGYAVARNMRVLSESLKEYTERKNELIEKYGNKNENGNYVVINGTDGYRKYLEEIKEYDGIEHDVDIMQVEPEEIYKSSLTADIISNIMFMIKEEG